MVAIIQFAKVAAYVHSRTHVSSVPKVKQHYLEEVHSRSMYVEHSVCMKK